MSVSVVGDGDGDGVPVARRRCKSMLSFQKLDVHKCSIELFRSTSLKEPDELPNDADAVVPVEIVAVADNVHAHAQSAVPSP